VLAGEAGAAPGAAENGDDEAMGDEGVASAESGGAEVTNDGEAELGVGLTAAPVT
jgi:hypothetical protein